MYPALFSIFSLFLLSPSCFSLPFIPTLTDKKLKDYLVYRPAILFFGLVDALYRILWSQVSFDASAASSSAGSTPPPGATAAASSSSSESSWSSAMSEWIRNNDQAISDALPK